MKIKLFYLLLVSLTTACVTTSKNSIQQAVNGSHRSESHKERDQYRHPQQTLEFFEVEDDMTVVEIWPGASGWYTEILAPLLKDNGTLYAAHFSQDSKVPYFRTSLEKFKEKTAGRPDIFGKLVLTQLQPPEQLSIAPKESADRVLTFRNVHNWMKNGQAEAVFKAMYSALKPGGILGVVQHRNPAGSVQDLSAKSGYVTEEYVISLARNAGFKLLAKSEINANPKDKTIHPQGVWTLPPSLRLKDLDQEKYWSIGESDRMTIKFIKP
jgi:predicted methyltransferase